MNKALWLLRPALATLVAILFSACVSRQVVPASGSMGGSVAPTLVLEQFLAAANAAAANDPQGILAMGRLFGTKDGPVINRDARRDVEQWMFVLANLLKHEQYEIQGEQMVPGRLSEAKRFMVQMKLQERSVVVPFTLVLARRDQWLVEAFDAEVITGR